MADFVSSAAANTVGNLATQYASPYFSYFFDFGKIVEDFKHRRNQLELKRNKVQDDVDDAIRQTEEIKKDVQDWLTMAEKELREAQNLEDEIEGNKCFKWCPNWGWRYCLSKKVAKKTLCISRLLETSEFPRVGYCVPLQGIEFLLSNDFLPSESSKAALNGIMKALSSDGVSLIGLYGMPGVGKTTLVEEVGKQARKLFDKVVIFTVSQTPNINDIQDKIAATLGLEFQTTTDQGVKAEKLWRRLKGEKKILIIVDDVWDRLELKRIGIPFGADHEGCKILLTTRLQQVCTKMDCQEKIQLDIFSQSEAWALFKDNAGLENASPPLNDVAKEVARECKGLPLAIVTIARALKGETIDEWETVNKRLKESRHSENQEICEVIYSRLKISYDYLKSKNSQTCLQLCSLFPEDHEISVEELTIYGIGHGMFHNVNSIEDARREMSVTITNLQKFGLLLETNDVRFAKMHDVVRDFVHWITSEGENMSLVKSGLKEWPRSESLGCYTAISLIKVDINYFPDGLEFPKLEAFLLDGRGAYANRMFHEVPNMFFQGMKALKVLVLRYVSPSLEGLQFLPNLRTLQLENCKARNASSLGNLKKLEILVIDHTYPVKMLCDYLMGLTTLRKLTIDIPFNEDIYLPDNLLSSLVQLEELYLGLRIKWAFTEQSANGASLSELRFLPRLTHLSLQLLSECIPARFVFPPLQRFDISVNQINFYPYRWHMSQRRLTITNFSLTAFEELFCNVEELALRQIVDLEYLIDATKQQGPKSAFNNLEILTLKNMICLKELCHGLPPIGFLQKLEFLTIENCPNAVFEIVATKNLKELRVEDCGQLQVIFLMDGVLLHTGEEIHAPLLSNMTSLHLVSLPELTIIWRRPSHHVSSLRSLRKVTIRCCNKLKSVFSFSLAQTLVHLDGLEISNCNGLEQVFDCVEERDGTNIMHPDHQYQSLGLSNLKSLYLDSLPELRSLWTKPSHHVISLQSLNEVTIECCNKLKSVFSLSLAQTLVHLDSLGISNCNGLEQVFDCAEERDGAEIMHLDHQHQSLGLSNLKSLYLYSLPELRSLWTGPSHHVISLQSLNEVTIQCCNKLKSVFLLSLAQTLVHLDGLEISNCNELEQVFDCAEEKDGTEIMHPDHQYQSLGLSNLKSLDLDSLPELRSLWTSHHVISLQSLNKVTIRCCNKLKSVFSLSLAQTLVHLDGLEISNCNGLEQVFDYAEERGGTEIMHLDHQYQSLGLSNLKSLNLDSLPELRSLWIGPSDHVISLQSLNTVTIQCCNKLKSVFSLSLAQTLVHLDDLAIFNCNGLEQVFDCTEERGGTKIMHPDHQYQSLGLSNLKILYLDSLPELRSLWIGPRHHVISLQSLNQVIIQCCNKLKSIFSLSLAQTLVHLDELEISNCNGLEQVFDCAEERDGTKILRPDHQYQSLGLSNLKSLDQDSLPELRSLWAGPNHHVISLQSLNKVTIRCCNKLKFVFPFSLARSLLHLQELDVSDCDGLEQVFYCAEETDHVEDITFPQLHTLVLKGLISLRNLDTENNFVKLPSLKKLTVHGCGQLTNFKGFQLCGFKEMISCSKNLTLNRTRACKNLIPDVDPEGLNGLTFLQLHNFSDLECLYDATEHRQPTTAFSNLVELVMEEMIGLKMLCNNQPPKGFLQKLEKLKITNCMHIASLSHVGQNLKEVRIKDCGQLQEIFHVDQVLHGREENQAPLLSNLTYLELESLSDLMCIWKGPSHSLINVQSLKTVKISNCNRLRCVFSPSLVKSLVNLELLFLRDLPELEQLITELESDAEQEQQDINKVKEKVDREHKLFLPSLKKFEVFKCPRLAPFVIQQAVKNQAQVKGLYLSNQQCNSFDILLRQSLPNSEPFTVGNHLQFLQLLNVSNCSKLKSLFSPILVQSLPRLSYLYIEQCEELEQIIDKDKTSASSSQGICIPSLIEICIEECNNLKILFSVSDTLSLSQLQRLTIKGASRLEQVFEYQGRMDIEDAEKEIALPQLTRLSLEELPRLKSFAPIGYHYSFPNLYSLKVEKCPNLTTSFSTDSKRTMHARTKAVADVPMEGSATDVDIMEVSDGHGKTTRRIGSDINWSRWED